MKTIIANFKMNKTCSQTKQYLMRLICEYDGKNEVIVALPYTSLALGSFLLQGKNNIKLGAQNLSDEEEGENTGEISGTMLKEVGVDTVIVGHSERRTKFKENGKAINKKIKIALKNAMRIVLCIGESEIDKKCGKESEVLRKQLEEALNGLYENELERIFVAYEPVWAIGTDKSASMRDVEKAVKIIKGVIKENFSKKAAEELNIVYGGSVNIRNANLFCGCTGIRGLLIGRDCLDANNFLKLLSSISK